MSYIIKGILNRKLPWSLVLLGVMISLVLELAGIPSLAFAVGVYLPLSSSTPIFVGGMIRWLVDRHTKQKHAAEKLDEEALAALGDKSPGVLMASGYIAGGAISGIVIAFMATKFGDLSDGIDKWMTAHNPLYAGEWSDALSLLPFVLIGLVLWLAGREVLFGAPKPQ